MPRSSGVEKLIQESLSVAEHSGASVFFETWQSVGASSTGFISMKKLFIPEYKRTPSALFE